MKVLIAEPDRLVRRTVAHMFEHYGYATFAAERTRAAGAVVDAEGVDFLFVHLSFDADKQVKAIVDGARQLRQV